MTIPTTFSELISTIIDLLISLPAVIIAITFHECAHGYAAHLLGDDTAYEQGRLTLNPLAHLDVFGFFCLLILRFGWAKPVPVNPYRFTKVKSKKLGMAITAAAGPVSNFLVSFVALGLYLGLYSILAQSIAGGYVLSFIQVLAVINIGLGVFNLFPVSPLDGSKIFLTFLPDRAYQKVMQYERFGYIALVILLVTGLLSAPLSFVRNLIINGMLSFWGLVF